MKASRIHLSNISYIAAFVIGVILFAVFMKSLFGTASSAMVLAGMAGVAITVTAFRIRQELHSHKKEK
ncbi:MAG: hypothetical protein QY332_15475 [Anaerolineales bacterium]|nr:MAG: hypothetical protein QY332_15475 [Anaerolineales bacterium]